MKKLPTLRKRHGIMIAAVLALLSIGAGVALASGGGEQGGGTVGWIATDTYRVINFAVLALALFFLLRKPLSKGLNDRIKGIEQQLSDLEEKKKAAEKQLAEYSERLAMLDKEAESIIAGYIQQGNDAKSRILEEAKAAAGKLEEQAKRTIEHEFKQAKIRLQEEVLEKALTRAEEIIKGQITDNDQDRLVDEYLEKVVA